MLGIGLAKTGYGHVGVCVHVREKGIYELACVGCCVCGCDANDGEESCDGDAGTVLAPRHPLATLTAANGLAGLPT